MKKILFIPLLLITAFAFGQPGYTNIFNKYHWDGGLFRRLGIPAGDSAQFLSGQAHRQGSVYMDTVNTPDSPNGYYIWEDPTGGNAPFWNLQGNDQICQNRLITDWNVSWQGVGFNYSVHGGLSDGTGEYQIGCSFYSGDSATVTFTTADPDEDRIDIIYLDATGVHVREGELAAPGTAVRPTVDADEILLTEVLVAAGATTPTLTQLIVYNENTESVVTNTGTTTNGANNTNVYIGTLSTNVTNINHNDQVFFTKAPPASTWGVLGFDGISLAIRLKATMPTNANLGVALQVGATTSGVEVIVPLVKTNSTSYQQISIPLSAFGNMANTNITRVRFRYIRPASGATYTGFYLDYIYFVDGFSSGPGAAATFTFNPPVGFQVTPANTQQSPGTWTMGYATGTLPGQYYTREGFITLPDFVNAMGALDGRTKTAEGATIDGNELFLQTVDTDDDGLMTSAMFNKLDSNYYIANAGDGDTLAFPDPISANITRIKSVKGIGGIVITTTDTTVIWDGTGVGGSGGRFGVATEDDVAAETRSFLIPAGTELQLSAEEDGNLHFTKSGGGGDWSMEILFDNQNLQLNTTSLLGNANIILGGSEVHLESGTGHYEFLDLADDLTATKVIVYNTTSDRIGTVDLAGLGGGSGATTALDNLASVAINTSLISDANNTDDLGSAANAWKDGYFRRILLDGATSGTVEIISDDLSNAPNVTTLSGTGFMPATMYATVQGGDFTLIDNNADQDAFPSTSNTWTLQGSTTYYFEGMYYITSGAVSHSIAMGFTLAGGASITSILYSALSWPVGINIAVSTQTTTMIAQVASTAVNAAGATATQHVRFYGHIRMNAGGTVTPIIKFSAAPGGTNLMKQDSYIRFTPVGTNVVEKLGNVN